MKRLFALLLALIFAAAPVSALTPDRRNPDAAGKLVALTFDDGPHKEYTRQILDILDGFGVKATFFIVGSNAKAYPDRIKMIADRGHELGNHTYDHVWINKIGEEELVRQIRDTEEQIFSVTGIRPRVFRPPYGAYSEASVETVRRLGYRCVLWSQDSRDWQLPPAEKIVGSITDGCKNGDILLFHDYNLKNSPTPRALRELIPRLLDMGYRFVTVSELFGDG